MGIRFYMNSFILNAENIYKSYQNNKKVKIEVLKGISVKVIPQKISVIIGASGAGKSTLLHLLGALDRPDSGKVIYDDKNIFEFSDEKLAQFRSKNIGFVFQFHHLLPEFTALENIIIPQMINGKTIEEARSRGEELLERVGLKDRMNHKPAELSGGEQQRVAVARALANNPQIIFADEPTGNLDSKNSESIHQLIIELRNTMDVTFVIVTHNANVVKLADIVYEIKDGKLSEKDL